MHYLGATGHRIERVKRGHDLMVIEAVLEKLELPRKMEVRPDDATGWMFPFAVEAEQICAAAGVDFVFLESPVMQAVAVQDDCDIVGVNAGMFWMLCRLAALVARSGVFPAMKGEAQPSWEPEPARSLRTPRELLDETVPFDWQLESIGWKGDPDRQILFYAVLSVSFRFVVLHELGHLMNDHGRRKAKWNPQPLLVDRPGPRLVESQEALRSQAREIVADGYAFLKTVDLFHQSLECADTQEVARIIRERLAPDAAALIRFVLSILFLYFRILDRSDWMRLPIDRLTHPPAPFRMKAIFGLLIDNRPLGIDKDTAIAIILQAKEAGDALMSVMLDIYPEPHWLGQISTLENDRHYERIYTECFNWFGRLAPAREH